jgi:hypothetical protein
MQVLLYYGIFAGLVTLYGMIAVYIPVIWGLTIRKPTSVGGRYPYTSLFSMTMLSLLLAPFLVKPLLFGGDIFKNSLYNSLGEDA